MIKKKFRAWIADENRMIFPKKITVFDDIVYVYDPDSDYEYQIDPKHLSRS